MSVNSVIETVKNHSNQTTWRQPSIANLVLPELERFKNQIYIYVDFWSAFSYNLSDQYTRVIYSEFVVFYFPT